MSDNRQSIRERISPFDANVEAIPTIAPTDEDQRTAEFMAKLRARTDALDAVKPEPPAVKKAKGRRSAPPPSTPSWYNAQPIAAPKSTKSTTKRFESAHSYPGRRPNKPKAQ